MKLSIKQYSWIVCAALVAVFPKVKADGISHPILTEFGGRNEYLLVTTSTDSQSIAQSGKYEISGYFEIPKSIKLNYQTFSDQDTFGLQVMIPAPGAFSPLEITDDVNPPVGANYINLSVLQYNGQIIFSVDSLFSATLSQWDKNTEVTYRKCKSTNDVVIMSLAKFDVNQFIQAVNECGIAGKTSTLTLRKNTPISDSDQIAILKSFKIKLSGVIKNITQKTVTFPFPEPNELFTNVQKVSTPFFQAFDLLDQFVIPRFLESASTKEYIKSVGEIAWRRNFLNQAIDHYFASANRINGEPDQPSCTAYQVSLKEHPTNENYKTIFYQSKMDDLVIPLVAVREQ